MLISAMIRNRCYLFYGSAKLYENIYITSSSGDSSTSISNDLTLNVTEKVGFIIYGSSTAINTGMSLASAGDFNNDGYGDIVISASFSSSNIIYLVFGSGKMKNVLYLDQLSKKSGLKFTGSLGSFAGISVSGIGDMNGDGFDDFVIGCLPYVQGYSTQISFVVYGTPDNLTTNFVTSLSSLSLPDRGMKIIGGGLVVAGPGDINNDGYNDLLVTNYQSWMNQKGIFLIKYPEKWTSSPTVAPSFSPTHSPTVKLSLSPSIASTKVPTVDPSTVKPSLNPSASPIGPTLFPTVLPTSPSSFPSSHPLQVIPIPSLYPTVTPSFVPTFLPIISNNFIN
jgi:hypothetical protein